MTVGHGAAAQAGQCLRLVAGAGDSAAQFQGLLVAPLSLREVTADPVQRPSLVERLGLTTPVTEVAQDAQGLLQGLGRSRVITRRQPHDPEVAEGAGLAAPIAEVAVDAQGLGRGRVITGHPPHVPEIGEGVGLAGPVTEMPRGLDRGGVPGDGLGPGAVAPQQPGQAGGQRDDPGVLAGGGGMVQASEQAGPLGPGPSQRLLPVGQVGRRGRYRAVRRAGSGAGLAGDEGVGASGSVLVVIQQPGGGLVPVTVQVQPAAQGAGVLADQVVQPVPALDRLGEQVLVIQRLQAAAGVRQAGAV